MKSVIFAFLISFTINTFASEQKPTMKCLSEDAYFSLHIYPNLDQITVFDEDQQEITHSVSNLVIKYVGNSLKAFNPKGYNNLPEGIIFEANLDSPNLNAYSVDDFAGNKTFYHCQFL